RIKYKDRN
ncbi:hypothetical protein ACTFIU_002051, partial [Dictyostelium citrinum]